MTNSFINKLKSHHFLYQTISYAKGKVFDFKYKRISQKWFLTKNKIIDINLCQEIGEKAKLNIIWCGINENQDRSGLIQGLGKIFNTRIYYRPNKKYGLKNNSIYNSDSINENGEKLYDYVKAESIKSKIDYIIGQFMGININAYWLNKIQELGIKVISFSWDDKLTFLWNKKYKIGCHSISKNIDFVLGSSIKPLNSYTKTRPIFFPLGSSPEIFSGNAHSKKTIDVLFIGNQYGVRKDIIHFLKQNNINIEYYGNGWRTSYLSYQESAKKFKEAKIIIGIGYVSHSRNITTLKLRDFDASISGALYITSKNNELEKLFPGNELEFYEDKEELLNKINFYLENKDLRIQKAVALQEYVNKNFTWEILFKKLDNYLKNKKI